MAAAAPARWFIFQPKSEGSEMTNEDTKPEALLTELTDLRNRVAKLEDALREAELRVRAVAQSAIDAIISINYEDQIIFWNQGAENIFGYSEAEVLGKPITMLIPERYRDAHSGGVKRYLATGQPVLIGKTVELQALRKGGGEFPIELSLSTWKGKGRIFFTGIIRDISDRKEAERALEQRTIEARQRTEELESLIQMVAHDLKSPVITIGGMVRRLRNEMSHLPADERREQMLSHLISSAETMEHFLKDLLDGLSLEHSDPETVPMRLDQAIKEVVEQHSQTLMDKGIHLRIDIAPSTPVVGGDKCRIRQVIENILVNAIRHMGERADPSIHIQVIESRDSFITKIADNGRGIPKEYQARIFERFFRVPGQTDHGGTGLGLSIVRKIVESHAGNIWVESEEGKGAIFCFTLPKCRAA